MTEMGWIVPMIDDLASDLSAFHRVDDWRSLTVDRFMSLAGRIAAYDGAVAKRYRGYQSQRGSQLVSGGDIEMMRDAARRRIHGQQEIKYVSVAEAARLSM